MKNWNTDTRAFRSEGDKTIWELIQKIDYGLDGERLKETELRTYWNDIKGHIAPENRRLLELYLGENNTHSQPTQHSGTSRSRSGHNRSVLFDRRYAGKTSQVQNNSIEWSRNGL